MIIKKIEGLRNERLEKIEGLNGKLEQVKNDGMYAAEYKQQVTSEINEQLFNVRHEYDIAINEIVTSARRETVKKLDEAEFSHLTQEAATKLMIKEMRNRDLSDSLVLQHKGENKDNLHEGPLYTMAKEAVENGLSDAPGYLSALKRLGVSTVDLDQQYKDSTMNSEQRKYSEELQGINNQAHLYEVDKTSETNPLLGALKEHYGNA